MDIHMPLCDGLSSTTQVRSFEKRTGKAHTSIVGVTANCDRNGKPDLTEIRECKSHGMDALTTKPLNDQKLKYHLEVSEQNCVRLDAD